MRKLFSIIIPFHNSEKTLSKCLDAIFNSSFKNREVIAVSDNANQESVEIAKKYNLNLYILKKNCGVAFARNFGAKKANGKFLIFIDSDVVIKKNHLLEVKKKILKYKNELAFQGIYSHKVNYSNPIVQYLQSYQCFYIFSKKIKFIKNLNGSFLVLERSFFKKLKGFDESFLSSNAEDADLGYKILEKKKKIRILRNVAVNHLPSWSLSDFIRKILRIHTGEMKIYLRKKNINKKVSQLNYLPIILSIVNIFSQIVIIPFINLVDFKLISFFYIIMNFIIYLLNWKFIYFIYSEKNFKTVLKVIPIFYLHIFLFIVCFFRGIIEFYLFGKKY